MAEEPEGTEETETEPQEEKKAPEKKKVKKERLRGFAGIIKEQLDVVNSIPKFKETFGTEDVKFLLVATDMYPAALAHVDKGELKISAVPEAECKEWKKTGAQSLLQCTTEQFMDIAAGKLDPVKAWLQRRIKLRGLLKLLLLNKVFSIIPQ